jgi:hypothetical protein
MRSTVIRQDYRRLNLLMSSRFINIERLVNASPVLGISFMVLSLDSAELGDRVSIALNLAGLGLYFKGKVKSKGHCRWILSVIALAAEDALTLCSTGPRLNRFLDNGQFSYLRWPHLCDLVHLDSRYPPRISASDHALAFEPQGMIVDVLFLTNRPEPPTKISRHNARSFLLHCWEKHRGIVSAIYPQWTQPNFDRRKFFTQRTTNYLACAVDCGISWMANILNVMGCDTVAQGLKSYTEEIYEDVWPAVSNHLFDSCREDVVALDEEQKMKLLRFITFSFHHSLLLGKPEKTAKILVDGRDGGALVTLPKSISPASEVLLAVPVALAGPAYTFVKRLWYLQRVEAPAESYQVIAKTYLWGCDSIKEQGEHVHLRRHVCIVE